MKIDVDVRGIIKYLREQDLFYADIVKDFKAGRISREVALERMAHINQYCRKYFNSTEPLAIEAKPHINEMLEQIEWASDYASENKGNSNEVKKAKAAINDLSKTILSELKVFDEEIIKKKTRAEKERRFNDLADYYASQGYEGWFCAMYGSDYSE